MQEDFKQVKLTEQHVKGYISAYDTLQKALEKIEKAGEEPDPKLIAELEAIAKKHGFSSFDELDSVASTITFMMTGFDQETGSFTEPRKVMQDEIAALKGDKSLKDKERKELLGELEQALKVAPDVAHKSNIDLVKKYLKQLEKIS